MNMLEINETIESLIKEIWSLSKKLEAIIRNQIILELKNIITKAKSSVGDLNSTMEGREERVCERRNRTVKITQSEW